MDTAEFRRILGHWTTGVAIVTSVDDAGAARGLTANAVASVSLDPPLVLACVERTADTHDVIQAAGFFCINVLAQTDERLARRFAADGERRFEGMAFHAGVTGAPILDEALAWVECHVRTICDGGDHSIFIGDVIAGDAHEGDPLVFYRGGYGGLKP